MNNAFGLSVLWIIIYISYGSSVAISSTTMTAANTAATGITKKESILSIIKRFLPKSCQELFLHLGYCGVPFRVNGCIRIVCNIHLFKALHPIYYIFCFTIHNAKSLKAPCDRILKGRNL